MNYQEVKLSTVSEENQISAIRSKALTAHCGTYEFLLLIVKFCLTYHTDYFMEALESYAIVVHIWDYENQAKNITHSYIASYSCFILVSW